MKVNSSFYPGGNVGIFSLNEAYFRFEYSSLLRVDCNDENYIGNLAEEQKTLFQSLCEFKNKECHIFKKIIFEGNTITIELIVPWDEESLRHTENIIKWSWPQFFLELNP